MSEQRSAQSFCFMEDISDMSRERLPPCVSKGNASAVQEEIRPRGEAGAEEGNATSASDRHIWCSSGLWPNNMHACRFRRDSGRKRCPEIVA